MANKLPRKTAPYGGKGILQQIGLGGTAVQAYTGGRLLPLPTSKQNRVITMHQTAIVQFGAFFYDRQSIFTGKGDFAGDGNS